jgi:hypothetical protein
MKAVLSLSIFLLLLVNITISSPAKTLLTKKISLKHLRSLYEKRRLEDTDTDTTPSADGNSTVIPQPHSGSGLSTGGIIGIAIPCIAALVGVGAAAAILGGSGAAAAPVLAHPAVASLPPPNYIDTSMAKLAVPQEIPVQPPQVVQPVVEVPPQPVQQVVPITKVEPPLIPNTIPQQPVVQPVIQPQMVPVQQMQLVPVQQVEMVPVQQVEMVPVQQVVPTYQAAQVAPQITQVSEIPSVTQVGGIQGAQVIQGGQGIQGIQGGEFISAPEGYGTSNIQGVGQINSTEGLDFSLNNLI